MAEIPATRASLLVRLRDPRDEAGWREFVDLYTPLVYGYARKQGLQDADAADLSGTARPAGRRRQGPAAARPACRRSDPRASRPDPGSSYGAALRPSSQPGRCARARPHRVEQ